MSQGLQGQTAQTGRRRCRQPARCRQQTVRSPQRPVKRRTRRKRPWEVIQSPWRVTRVSYTGASSACFSGCSCASSGRCPWGRTWLVEHHQGKAEAVGCVRVECGNRPCGEGFGGLERLSVATLHRTPLHGQHVGLSREAEGDPPVSSFLLGPGISFLLGGMLFELQHDLTPLPAPSSASGSQERGRPAVPAAALLRPHPPAQLPAPGFPGRCHPLLPGRCELGHSHHDSREGKPTEDHPVMAELFTMAPASVDTLYCPRSTRPIPWHPFGQGPPGV